MMARAESVIPSLHQLIEQTEEASSLLTFLLNLGLILGGLFPKYFLWWLRQKIESSELLRFLPGENGIGKRLVRGSWKLIFLHR
jgi:hypothetical protein